MKKLFQIMACCLIAISLQAKNSISLDSLCSVNVNWDSLNTTGDILVTADPTGTAPFSYLWNTSDSTQSIQINGWGGINYCVTVTDANGCVAEACVFSQNTCDVSIESTAAGGLYANASGTAPFSFVWSNGSTASNIAPNAPGNYCVTMTDATGCNAYGCYWYGTSPGSCTVYLSLDSTNTGGTNIVANAIGAAPFTYIWSTNETTAAIELTQPGVNYCVTITSSDGCTSSECLFGTTDCYVAIGTDPVNGLVTAVSGVFPMSFLWSNGATTQNMLPNAPGNYCVTMTDAVGCITSSCLWWWGTNPDSCSVYISYDSLGTGDYFTAIASGTAPFTYAWNLGQTTQSIPLDPAYFGDYCVTVTDAEGCESVDCIWGNNPCSVWILQEDSAGMTGLFAIASVPFGATSYLWSNGSTDDVIFPTTAGAYCVTVTGGGCVASGCYQFSLPSNMQINGDIHHPDSLNAGPLDGIVELFYNDPTTNTWGVVATTTIQNDPNSWWNAYEFGNQTNPGQYIVKVTLDPASPYAADFLPTYHHSSVLWDEADIITLPSSGWGLYNVLMSDGQNLINGDGQINGTVTEGDGFTANEDDRSGTPRPNTSVLLFDENEQPITHTLTDANGQYSFANLPFGTYKVMVEIVGIEQAEKWVTLTANNPTSEGNDFEVTETGIVLGLDDIFVGQKLEAFPNPTADKLNVWLETRQNIEARFIVSRTDGTTLLVENQSVAKGGQYISLDLGSLPSGLYLMQVVAGTEVVSTKIVKQ